MTAQTGGLRHYGTQSLRERRNARRELCVALHIALQSFDAATDRLEVARQAIEPGLARRLDEIRRQKRTELRIDVSNGGGEHRRAQLVERPSHGAPFLKRLEHHALQPIGGVVDIPAT